MNIIFIFCFFAGAFIVFASLFTFTLTMQHLYCIPVSSEASAVHIEAGSMHIRTYTSLSVGFATLNVLLTFSTYPICTQWSCDDIWLGLTLSILFWNIYTLTKLLLYLALIARLFNPHYQQIYGYPKCIQYLLWMLLMLLLTIMMVFNINSMLYFAEIDPPESIDIISMALYAVTDSAMSLACMFLFFRPICRRLSADTMFPNMDTLAVRKYALVSVLQLLASVFFELSFLGRLYLWMINSSKDALKVYLEIWHVVQMLDCLLLMICIYIGFARKKTVCVLFIFTLWEHCGFHSLLPV